MVERANVLAAHTATGAEKMRASALDPDAAARVASFGEIPPMRQRGLAAVRAAIESAPTPDGMPEMAVYHGHRPAPAPPGRSRSGFTVRQAIPALRSLSTYTVADSSWVPTTRSSH